MKGARQEISRVNKYRGLHNDEWVYGYYAVIGKRSVIIKLNSESYYSVGENLQKRSGNEIVDVKTDTVGQYIGIDDKNGKEIYKKDIVKVDGKRELFTVVWVCDTARFGLQGKEELLYFEFGIGSRIEVIGNVYENADLLREAGND